MSLEQLEQSVLNLPPEERRQFAHWFYQQEDKLLASSGDDSVHPDIQAEILRRRDEVEAHPELLEPWEGTTERVRARLHELRQPKAAAR